MALTVLIMCMHLDDAVTVKPARPKSEWASALWVKILYIECIMSQHNHSKRVHYVHVHVAEGCIVRVHRVIKSLKASYMCKCCACCIRVHHVIKSLKASYMCKCFACCIRVHRVIKSLKASYMCKCFACCIADHVNYNQAHVHVQYMYVQCIHNMYFRLQLVLS